MLRKILLLITIFCTTAAYADCSSDQTHLINAFNQFAFDFNHQISLNKENTILSPYSVSSLLALLSNGANGNTQTQLLKTLHLEKTPAHCFLNKDLDNINSALHFSKPHTEFYADIKTLASKLGFGSQPPSFVIANAIWSKKGLDYQPAFIASLQGNQTTTFHTVDFAEDPEHAGKMINNWVSEKTNGKIDQLMTPQAISSNTQLMLINAIYFRGFWQHAFKTANTQQQSFTREDGKQSTAMMMNQTEHFLYTDNNILQLLQLPYKDSHFIMVIILPRQNISLMQVQQSLNAKSFAQLLATSVDTKINVSLPRFKLNAKMNLSDTLKKLGVVDLFSNKADFSQLAIQPLVVSKVFQEAMIDVDETGTTAAAATGTTLFGAPPSEPVIFNANHPFLFYIVDTKTGLILFMGSIKHP